MRDMRVGTSVTAEIKKCVLLLEINYKPSYCSDDSISKPVLAFEYDPISIVESS